MSRCSSMWMGNTSPISSMTRTSSLSQSPWKCGSAASPAPAFTASIRPCQWSLLVATVAWGAIERIQRARIVRDRAVAVDHEMPLQTLQAIWPAMLFHISTAGIHGPGHVRDLAADESFIPGFADAERDVGLALRQVECPVADRELHPKTRVPRVKGVDKRAPPEAIRHARSTRQANRAGEARIAGGAATRESCHRCLHILGGGPQAARARERQEIPEIVPCKRAHGSSMQFCGRLSQSCDCPRRPPHSSIL